jgi:2-deoxy-D-gluconate 3-dehydrogenase
MNAARHEFLDLRADLVTQNDIPYIIEKTLAHFGKINILINNAGIIRREDAVDFSEKDWDDVMNVNSKSLFFLSQTVAKQFIKQGKGGKIINIASMLSFQGGIRVPSYTASKSAVMGLTKAMANEWAKYNINVNAIAPGYMATNNTAALQADEARNAAILDRIPAERWGTPEDIAGPCVFLASDAANYINGYTIAVDGGWLAR